MSMRKDINIITSKHATLRNKPVTIVVVFEPQGSYDDFNPIVWQVDSWEATGEQSMKPFNWFAYPGAFVALDNPSDDHDLAAYVPITRGHFAVLDRFEGKLHWTGPFASPTDPNADPRAWNGTGYNAKIGYGFEDSTGFRPFGQSLIAYCDVEDKQPIDAHFSPMMSVYVFETDTLDKPFTPGQILTSPLDTACRFWYKDLSIIQPNEVDLTLYVYYDMIMEKYVVSQCDIGPGPYPAMGRVLSAKVAFDEYTSASQALDILQDSLAQEGYVVDTVKYGNAYYGEIHIETTEKSCAQMQAALEHALPYPGADIIALSGRALLKNDNVAGIYMDIDPMSQAWNEIETKPLAQLMAATNGKVPGYDKMVQGILADVSPAVSVVNGNGNDVYGASYKTALKNPVAPEISAAA